MLTQEREREVEICFRQNDKWTFMTKDFLYFEND